MLSAPSQSGIWPILHSAVTTIQYKPLALSSISAHLGGRSNWHSWRTKDIPFRFCPLLYSQTPVESGFGASCWSGRHSGGIDVRFWSRAAPNICYPGAAMGPAGRRHGPIQLGLELDIFFAAPSFC